MISDRTDREPAPPQTPRGDALGQLQRELWLAQDAGETTRATELEQRIRQLSARSSTTAPQRETTAAAPPLRESAGATSPAMKTTTRSPRVPRH